MTQVMEVFANTGEIIERDRTPTEQAQFELDQVAAQQAEQERDAAEAAKTAARESAVAKLAALGLNIDEVEAIIGGV